ncbi:MgtC/SapB family protein [Lutimaribacter sp. EGI FJ00015]|uniref:MgtC/SapB family protein n=1 Tax=Lutimaribacter degradans TaxID=2945989 RepID=A0ACC5ZTK8_9RHOB|nr:MgtC/SapB family protein [Lutimaribacter sp. EGI FJ00013]MCM2561683.1 MgtC/SapB family protein [Lutimaribacter sp. EGI FJ00013]MCO0612604.1 MgtC/SapB family protein [Lutimaribacter sp. EGI FJ00015]MCO0635263.1 MgtC/SapB family protein [Lutimaribacter sp. EGI FJ00014]
MPEFEIFLRLGLALAIGLLLGLERGWHGRTEDEGDRIAGIRTFALTGMLGGVSGWLADLIAPSFPAFALLALGGLLALSYWLRLREDDDLGLTTEIALMLTFALGAASVIGEMAPVAAVAVVAAILLSMKPTLHHWVGQIERFELESLFKLALISVVILPLLPDQGYGPGEVLNPYELWWAVVIVAALSFVGYLAIRIAGARFGILATGLFGGLASSTSTTLALARLVRGDGSLSQIAAAGIVIAGSVTFLRIVALVAVFEPALVAPLVWPMVTMAATGLAGAGLTQVFAGGERALHDEIPEIGNPLALKTALGFGAVLAVVLIAVHYLREWLGSEGVFAAAAFSGITDVDALTISVSRLIDQDLPLVDGAVAIFIAASVNTIVKAGISLFAGNGGLGLRVGVIYLATIAAGALSLWLVG